MRLLRTIVVLCAFASPLDAQERLVWSFGAGPALVQQRGMSVVSQRSFGSVSSEDTLLFGGIRNAKALSVAVARALRGTALNVRLELAYQISQSDPTEYTGWSSLQIAIRNALRDEIAGLHAGLEWNAVPAKSWSPYLVTSAGVVSSRLHWSADSTSRRPTRTTSAFGAAAHLGVGIRAMVFGANLFAETRRQFAVNVNGSRLQPLIVGVRFHQGQ